MQHYKVYCSFVLLLGFLAVACSSTEDEIPSLTVGQDFTETNIRVLSIDTFKVELSTMKFDSIPTSNLERLLVGTYEDEFLGTVTASSYLQLNASTYFIDDDAVLDSVGLVLDYEGYFYNDTTALATINVHKISQEFETDETSFYNTSELSYESDPLASLEFYPEPNRDSLYMSLPFESFGTVLFESIKNNEITDDESLFQQLRGITLQPSSTDIGSIIGYSPVGTSTYLRFFYRIPEELEGEEQHFDLSISNFGLSYFNNITSDVSGSALNQIDNQESIISSTETNNYGYVQSGTGYATRIEFPTIKRINELGFSGTVLDAVLEIKPNNAGYSDIQPISDVLSLYLVDQNNDLTVQVANSADFVFGVLEDSNSEFNDVIYTIPVIDFVDKKLNELPETEDALIIIPPEYNSTVNKILLNDGFNTDFKARLIITYAIYED
ncbi:DUF4270 family protein [Winogradskyella sp. PG-2]|uniref:DUF4270 family protein n=1 Tax=Winogradskyella sp. PG-2 TaxID=754409 RepID=UPI0005EFC428|nr:DUF4270 family protein [Winogradskyella sp. PG-2]